MSQGSFNPKIRFLAQKLWSVARVQRHRQTHTHTKVNTEDILSGFQDFSIQPIIKDRSNLLEDWVTLATQSHFIAYLPTCSLVSPIYLLACLFVCIVCWIELKPMEFIYAFPIISCTHVPWSAMYPETSVLDDDMSTTRWRTTHILPDVLPSPHPPSQWSMSGMCPLLQSSLRKDATT